MDLPIIENGCGSCTACCTVLGVKELKKDDYTPCEHILNSKCGIYESRTTECQTYECFWLKSNEVEELRPDKLGVILECSETTIGPAVVVREVWKGASEGEVANQYINITAMYTNAFIYVFRPDNTRSAFFPPWVAHLASKAKHIVTYGWREAERIEKTKKSSEQKAKDAKKRARKMVSISKKRNR